jgi:hypothetical protein
VLQQLEGSNFLVIRSTASDLIECVLKPVPLSGDLSFARA